MIYFLLSLALLLFSRIFMAYRLREGAKVTDGDAMGHLTYVKEYYRTGGKPIDLTYLYILDGPDYPNGFHKLFYYLKIPVSWLEKYGGYLPTFFDAVHLSLAFLAIYLAGGAHYEWLLLFPLLRIFWGNEGRSSHFSERAYGVLWGNIYLLSVAAIYLTSDWIWLLAALPAFTVASISSKFTWQAMAFFSLILSVLCLTPIFIVIFGIAVVFSVLTTQGYSLHVLKGVIRHSLFYRDHFSPRNPTLRNNYKELFQPRVGLKKYIYNVFTNSPLRIITDFPVSIPVIAAILMGQPVGFWGQWVVAGIALVLLIATKPLKFLGEPERYLEFCIIPAFIFLSSFGPLDYPLATTLSIMAFLSVMAFHTLFQFIAHRSGAKERQQKDMLELRKFFQDIQSAKVLTIPFRLSFFLGYENNKNSFVTLFSNIGIGEYKEKYRWLMRDRYPYVRSDLVNVIKEYDLHYIAAMKSAVDIMNGSYEGGYYDFTPYDLVYENNNYVVYKVKA